ncbi:WD40/YVTN/BNR-like repeat-containing protein [Thiocapsa sp. UBA6158]|uniref:WD40/YVTN/BNR-like repeat-containing protein n=1 Tax=Thiocapsa sp. UBA6158 TaxID=1947692 RepID=UPI0025DBAA54|nr:sialidase family protein [Thiocapsa sp. UBA6158]
MTIRISAPTRGARVRAGVALFTAGVLLLPFALAAETSSSPTPAVALTPYTLNWDTNWQQRLDAAGQSWLGYYDQARMLRLRRPDGEVATMLPATERSQAPSGLAMTGLDAGAAVLWRDKFPVKGLYLGRLNEAGESAAAPLKIGEETEPLARFELARFGSRLHALWYGEKNSAPDEAQYNLYYRAYDLESSALTPIETLMPGIYPVWTSNPQGGLMAFSWLYNESPRRIAARFRPAGAEAFGETVTVAEVGEITPIFEAFRSGERWFAVWVSEREGAWQLEGARSDDAGKTWTAFTFEDLRDFDIGAISIAANDAGTILIAVDGQPGRGVNRPKSDVRLIRSIDRGETWSTASSPRPAELAAGYVARNPIVAFGPQDGQVLMVWEEWREIRARPYANLSLDGGETWAQQNVPLPFERNTNLGLRANPGALGVRDGRFHLIMLESPNDAVQSARLVEASFAPEELAEFARLAVENAPPSSDEGLRARVMAYWKAMMEEDYTASYKLFDPFFRDRNEQMSYLRQLGRIKYGEAAIDAVKIDGWRAEVKTRVTATIPPFTAKTGEVVSRPPRDVELTEVWLWMGDDWYREYYSEANDIKYVRY